MLSAETLAEVARVRASGALGAGGRLTELFDFLVERSGRGESPKEAEIAVLVFGKPDVDAAKDDPVARVYMHRLRKRLDDHYLRHGAPDGLRLEIPKGEYRLVGVRQDEIGPDVAAEEADGAVAAERPPGPQRRRWAMLAAAAVGLAIVGNIGAWAMFASRPADPIAEVRASPAWSEMAASQRPLLLVVGDYYIFGEYQDRLFLKRLIRDFAINSKDDLQQRYMIDPAQYDRYGDVALQYLPTSVAFAMADLMPLISDGRPVHVALASELTPDKLKSNDILYIGLLSGLGALRDPVFAHSRFRIGESYDQIHDRTTGVTYTSEAFLAAPSDTMYRDFGYFSTFQGPAGNRIAILAGARDTALMGVAENVTRASSLEALSGKAGRSGDFEALLETKGQKHVNLETRVLAAEAVDSAAIWSGEKPGDVTFPEE
jgi:hypothetical protein